MDSPTMLAELLRLLDSLDVKVQIRNLDDSSMPASSGLVKVRGKEVVYLHNRLSRKERTEVLIEALGNFDLTDVYMSPALRERLEKE